MTAGRDMSKPNRERRIDMTDHLAELTADHSLSERLRLAAMLLDQAKQLRTDNIKRIELERHARVILRLVDRELLAQVKVSP